MAVLAPAICPAASITYSLVDPGSNTVMAGSTVTLEVRATFDTRLVGIKFQIVASGDPVATLTGRSAAPTTPDGLTYVSKTSQDPFDNGLPHDLTTGPITEALLDLDYDSQPGGPTDGLAPGEDVLIETLDIVAVGTGLLTIMITDPSAAQTQSAQDGQLFDSVSIDPAAGTVTIEVITVPPDFDEDGDVDQNDYSTFESCASGPAIPHGGSETCQQADFDDDNDVDQSDFGVFQRCYSSEGNPADPNCAA